MSRIRWNTQLVAAEMKKENCILKSEYINTHTRESKGVRLVGGIK